MRNMTVPKYNYSNHERYFLKQIERKLKANQKIIVPTLSASFGDVIKDYVVKRFGDTKKIIFHKATGDEKDDEMFNDIHGENAWRSADLVIYSPKVSAGVDFNLDHFDCIFAYITNTADQCSFIQMINRARKIKDPNVICLLDPRLYSGTNSSYATYQVAENYYLYIDETIKLENHVQIEKVRRPNGGFGFEYCRKLNGLYSELQIYEVQKELNKHPSNYVTGLDRLLRKYGDKLYFKDIDNHEDAVDDSEKKITKVSKVEKLSKVDVDDFTRDEILSKEYKTEEDFLKLQKFDICEKYDLKDTSEEFLSAVVNYESKMTNLLDLINEKKVDENLDDYNKKKELLKRKIIKQLLEVLEIDNPLDEYDLDKSAFEDEDIFLFMNEDVIKTFGMRAKNNYQTIRSILEHYGLKLSKITKRKGREKNRSYELLGYELKLYEDVGNLLYLYIKSIGNRGLSNKSIRLINKYNKFKNLIKIYDRKKVNTDIKVNN